MEEQSSSCVEPIGGAGAGGAGEQEEVSMEAEVEVFGKELVWIVSPPGDSGKLIFQLLLET